MEPAITEWFNANTFGRNPSETIQQLAEFIVEDLKVFGLELEIDVDLFKRKLCTALCVLYKLSIEHKPLVLSFSSRPFYPPKWSNELEITWIDFLESQFFTIDYWDGLWGDIGTTSWEAEVFNWREQLQALIPCFIRRDINKMISDEGSDGEESCEDEGVPDDLT